MFHEVKVTALLAIHFIQTSKAYGFYIWAAGRSVLEMKSMKMKGPCYTMCSRSGKGKSITFKTDCTSFPAITTCLTWLLRPLRTRAHPAVASILHQPTTPAHQQPPNRATTLACRSCREQPTLVPTHRPRPPQSTWLSWHSRHGLFLDTFLTVCLPLLHTMTLSQTIADIHGSS